MVLDRLRRGGSRKDPKKIPDGLWVKCPSCAKTVFKRLVEDGLQTCPECGHHFPLSAPERVASLIDDDSWEEWATDLVSADPLEFIDTKPYPKRVATYQKKTGLNDAVIVGGGKLNGVDVGLGVMAFSFHGGSMGSVVGEKLTRMIERSLDEQRPVIIVSCSGGARMQEGALSLMQMAKTSAALGRLADKKLPYISVLAHPTFGGVTASFATLGDINIAEPKALVGFAGARVIANTIKQELPEGFQTAEFGMDHGQIDLIVRRQELKTEISRLLDYLHQAA